MIQTVLLHESELFQKEELDCFMRYATLSCEPFFQTSPRVP